MQCLTFTAQEYRETVRDCPCSAESTPHTAAWRASRILVTRLAREKPLLVPAEELLRGLARGERTEGREVGFLSVLRAHNLVTLVGGAPVITPLGRTYLAARDDVRTVTSVRVLDVDRAASTARIDVPAWGPDPVTVMAYQVAGDVGVGVAELPGLELLAEANCGAPDVDALVLTRFRDLVVGGPVEPWTRVAVCQPVTASAPPPFLLAGPDTSGGGV